MDVGGQVRERELDGALLRSSDNLNALMLFSSLSLLTFLLSLSGRARALPMDQVVLAPARATPSTDVRGPRPVVVWHGLGDAYSSDGMRSVAADIERAHPGTFVWNVRLDEAQGKDRNAGFVSARRRAGGG